MPIAKTISGDIKLSIVVPLPVPSPLFPRTVDVSYEWFPTDAPSVLANGRQVRGQVAVQVNAGTTMNQLLTAVRNAIQAQEAAADGGGNTVVEASPPPPPPPPP